MKPLALASLLLAASASAAPALLPQRVILRTDAGDVVLALYADAPRHAGKLLALFRAGAYDGSSFAKVDASRFAAVSSARHAPKAERLPVESGGPPRAGVVMMAHQAGDPDPGETAFVLLFADLSAMGGRYSAVGEVVGGKDVFEALKKTVVDAGDRPVLPLAVAGTEVLESERARPAKPLRGPDLAALGDAEIEERRLRLILAAAVFLAIAGALTRVRGRFGPAAASAALLGALAGFFAVFAAVADWSAGSAWVSVPLFAAAVGMFRLMGRFER